MNIIDPDFVNSEFFIGLKESQQNDYLEIIRVFKGEAYWESIVKCTVCEAPYFVDEYGNCVLESCREWDSLGECIACNTRFGFEPKTQESKCVFDCEYPYEEIAPGKCGIACADGFFFSNAKSAQDEDELECSPCMVAGCKHCVGKG